MKTVNIYEAKEVADFLMKRGFDIIEYHDLEYDVDGMVQLKGAHIQVGEGYLVVVEENGTSLTFHDEIGTVEEAERILRKVLDK